MPALNIRFSDDELDALRARAEAEGVPVTRLVHDSALDDATRAAHRARAMASAARVIEVAGPALEKLANL